jgi:type IV pilus assembly protein PilX
MAIIKYQAQQGIALVMALVMLLTLTGLAVTLMSTSNIDLKIAGAAQLTQMSDKTVKSEADKALKSQMDLLPQENKLLYLAGQFNELQSQSGIDITPVDSPAQAALFNMNHGPEVIDCPPKFAASSGIKCNMLEIQTQLNYGKAKRYSVVITNGIIQELAISGDGL